MRIILLLLLSLLPAFAQFNIGNPFYVAAFVRSSGAAFDPSQISGILQWNYGNGSSTAPGSETSTWTATTGADLTTESGAAAQPVVETNRVSGKAIKVFVFDGVGEYMTNGGAWTATEPYARFINFRLRDNALPTSRFLCAGNESGRADLRSDSAPVYSAYHGLAAFQNYASAPNINWHGLIQICDGVNNRIQIDGAAWDVIAVTAGSDTITGLCIAALYNGGGLVNPAAIDIESVGVIGNTNYHTWGQSLTNWMHDGIYGTR